MAGVEVKFETVKLSRILHRYKARNKNLPMDLVGQLIVNDVEEAFETQGGSTTDGGWDPLADSTIMRTPARAGGRILQRSGAMAAIQVTKVSGFRVTVASPVEYSKFHLEGTKHMPKRDFFALNFPNLLDSIGDLLLQEFQR